MVVFMLNNFNLPMGVELHFCNSVGPGRSQSPQRLLLLLLLSLSLFDTPPGAFEVSRLL